MSEPLDFWTAAELLHAYRTRALSPVEATRAALARIEKYCAADAERAKRLSICTSTR